MAPGILQLRAQPVLLDVLADANEKLKSQLGTTRSLIITAK
jgi:hypothetical protein